MVNMINGDHWHDVRGKTTMGITGFGIKAGKLRVAFDLKLYEYETDVENLCCKWLANSSIGTYFHNHVKILPTTRLR
jgi:hypothetical protein